MGWALNKAQIGLYLRSNYNRGTNAILINHAFHALSLSCLGIFNVTNYRVA
jgi:hypothetical protein